MNKKIWLSLLCVLFMMGVFVSAVGEVHKDEVIYARLSVQGHVQEVFAVNIFEAEEETQVEDYGVYEEAIPLGKVSDFSYQEDKTIFSMLPGRFSYQGKLKQKTLPWWFQIRYSLDGKEVVAEELSGASGKLECVLEVTVNEAHQATAQALSLQITISLDGDKARQIQAEKATQAIAGGNRTLTFVVLPGQNASYRFSALIEDFSMEGIQIAALRMGMDTEMYQKVAKEALAGSPLQDAVGGIMSNFLSNMSGKQPVSFTDIRNTIRSLQFVVMSEGIKAPAPAVVETPEPQPKTVWDRFLDLFGR